MSTTLSIIGAGGHCRSIISLLERNQVTIAGIFDDAFKPNEVILGHPVSGTLSDVPNDHQVILAVGDVVKRAELFERFKAQVYKPNLIHPQATIENYVTLGQSNQILADANLNAAVTIGDNNIINTKALLEHEVQIGNHNHIAVGAIICGRAKIGNGCFLGAGSVVIDGVSITDNVTIGANTVVIHDITEPGVYVGNPATKIK